MATILKYGLALLGLALGYGKMQSDVSHTQEDVKVMKGQVNSIFENLAWGERRNAGESGPAPPVPQPGGNDVPR